MKRGQVRFYKFKPPDKSRPILVLTRDQIIPYLNEVTIAPITSSIRGIPSEVILNQDDGLKTECAINLDHIQTVSKHSIGGLITTLSAEKMYQVGIAFCFALGFDDLAPHT